MEEMDELAAAAKQAWRRPYQPRQSSGKPILITAVVVIALLGAFAAIIWFMRPRTPATAAVPAVVVEEVPLPPDLRAEKLETEAATAAHVRFNAFTNRLATALAKYHRQALQAAAANDVTYNCRYDVRKTEVKRPKDANTPRECVATLSGTIDWKDEQSNTSLDSTKVMLTFTEVDGVWQVVKANSELVNHKDSAGLFGDPVKLGTIKNLVPIDWFNAAVAEAQKSE